MEMRIAKSTINVLYTCKVHKITLRRTFEQVKTYSMGNPYPRLVKVEYLENGKVLNTHNMLPSTICPTCKPSDIPHGMIPKPIKGRIVEHHACDSRCLNATGFNCNCACGGANHGKAHQVVYSVEA